MNTTTVNIKIDKKLKDDASALAEQFGLSLGGLVKTLLKQTVRQKYVTLDVRPELFPPEKMTPQMEKSIGEVDADIRAGRTKGPFTPEEFSAILKDVINQSRRDRKDKRKKKN